MPVLKNINEGKRESSLLKNKKPGPQEQANVGDAMSCHTRVFPPVTPEFPPCHSRMPLSGIQKIFCGNREAEKNKLASRLLQDYSRFKKLNHEAILKKSHGKIQDKF